MENAPLMTYVFHMSDADFRCEKLLQPLQPLARTEAPSIRNIQSRRRGLHIRPAFQFRANHRAYLQEGRWQESTISDPTAAIPRFRLFIQRKSALPATFPA